MRQHVGPDVALAGKVFDDVAESASLESPPHEFARDVSGYTGVPAVRVYPIDLVGMIGEDG